tara:strand:+ start:169 stop:408 length:240 start_codon:yes stop_codon:yes gene_type:complete
MVSMVVLTCIIWIEGSSYDGGESRCGLHEAEIKYSTIHACKQNISAYEEYVMKSIYDVFEMPTDFYLQTQCFERFGSEK